MVSLRPVTREDDALLYRIYASARAGELAQIGWSEAQKALFLKMQHGAQQRGHAAQFPRAQQSIVLRGEEPAGMLHVDREGEEIRLVDIALLPEHRGAGIGAFLLQSLLGEAATTGRPLRLQVAHGNPALHLYERLGLVRTGDTGVHHALEWTPPGR